MKEIEIKVQTLPHFEGLNLPQYMSHGASAMDLVAAVQSDLVLRPHEIILVPTGICLSIPAGFEAQIRPRSGLALKNGLVLPNAPGTIDSDYRGEIKVILMNLGREDFVIARGLRIAQMTLAEVIKARLVLADNLDNTKRGSGGFGHTGI